MILYPTDTVWGIGCDARCGKAVERIFRIKQRADSKAMIVLVGDLGQLERTVNEVPEVAYDLIEFSERPLTIVYDGVSPASGIAPGLCAADGTIAVRLTRERFSAALCKALGAPLVSTSANISGQPAATCFDEISQEIIDAVDYVCITGRQATSAARPSTVMRLGAGGIFKVLRP